MKKDLNLRAKQIIHKTTYITVASVNASGQPWNTPVFSAFDAGYNFYWGSHRGSQHSKNIQSNNKVFLVIYDSTVEAGTGEGVYVQAEVAELEDPGEIKAAHKLLQDRRPVPYWKLEEFEPGTPLALYKAVPKKIWMNDEGEAAGHYIDTRTEIKL